MDWINRHWAKIGGIIAVCIMVFALLSEMKITDIKSLLWIHFAMLLIHQFEEYVFPGKFKEFYNENIFNKNWMTRFPLSNRGIVMVNIVLGWMGCIISAMFYTKILWLALGLLVITILNGVLHSMMFIVKRKYNPGFITGLFLFIPLGTYILLKVLKYTKTQDLIAGIVIFVIGTALIPFSIYITSNKSI